VRGVHPHPAPLSPAGAPPFEPDLVEVLNTESCIVCLLLAHFGQRNFRPCAITIFSCRVPQSSHWHSYIGMKLISPAYASLRSKSKKFQELFFRQLRLAKDASQNGTRQIEPVMARYRHMQMKFQWMPQLGVTSTLMVNHKSGAHKSPQYSSGLQNRQHVCQAGTENRSFSNCALRSSGIGSPDFFKPSR